MVTFREVVIGKTRVGHISLETIARSLGVSRQTLWRKMQKPMKFSVEEIIRICDMAGIDPVEGMALLIRRPEKNE